MANISDASSGVTSDLISQTLGIPSPAPAPPVAQSTLGSAPTVSSTPIAGQGVALDAAGHLSASIAARAVQMLTADPINPVVGQIWYRTDTSQLCVRHDTATTKRVTFA